MFFYLNLALKHIFKLLIAGLITAFFVWCYWVRKKAHEKRRKMENEWTVDSEGAYETIASEDEDSDESELTGIWGEDEPDIEGGIGNPVSYGSNRASY